LGWDGPRSPNPRLFFPPFFSTLGPVFLPLFPHNTPLSRSLSPHSSTNKNHHRIYAAADFVLVPSLFEPCGLTQLIAMRYGAIPVVRATGGLADSVYDVDYGQGKAAWEVLGSTDPARDGPACTNGFVFEGTDGGAVDSALHRALDCFYGRDGDRSGFRALQARVMRQDWSW
jgi:starch synthase